MGGLRVPQRRGDPLSPACTTSPVICFGPRGCLAPLWVSAFSGLSQVVLAVPPLTCSGLSVTLSYQQSGMAATGSWTLSTHDGADPSGVHSSQLRPRQLEAGRGSRSGSPDFFSGIIYSSLPAAGRASHPHAVPLHVPGSCHPHTVREG